jgi:ADP-heptose:LPS heptosyltransferase
MHRFNSRDGIDLGSQGAWPPGEYLLEDLTAADFMQFGRRGASTMNWVGGNTLPFDETQDWNGRKILIIRPGGFGDLLFLTPSIEEIKRRWPHSIVHVCAYARFQDILRISAADAIVSYPLSMEEAICYDAWIFLENVIEGNPEAEHLHCVDVIAKRVGLSSLANKEMVYRLTEEEKIWAETMFPRTEKKRIAIQIEASSKARTYPGHLMTEVIIRLAQKDFEVFLLGQPGRLATKSLGNVRNLMIEGLSFRNSVAAMTTCDAVLGPDSVMVHIAGALKMPALGLYAAFPWALRTAYAKTVECITGHGGCDLAPCCYHGTKIAPHFPFDGPCFKSGRCEPMARIEPDRIIAKLEKMTSSK